MQEIKYNKCSWSDTKVTKDRCYMDTSLMMLNHEKPETLQFDVYDVYVKTAYDIIYMK